MNLPVVKIMGEELRGFLQNFDFLEEQFRLRLLIASSSRNLFTFFLFECLICVKHCAGCWDYIIGR